MFNMKCPKCQANMVEIRQDDIYIDVCKECRGVFLDAGELEQLLQDTDVNQKYNDKKSEHYDKKEKYHSKNHYYPKKKSKMKSILGDLFDF